MPIGGLRRPYLLPADTPVPDVPGGRNRILDRDLKAAGIQKVDEPGRIVDVHALRVTFVTWLTKAGVLPRVAQALMRHSTIDLTMNTYTDPRQLDMAGAISKLPPIPLSGGPASTAIAASPRGAADRRACQFAPTPDNRGESESNPAKMADSQQDRRKPKPHDVSAYPVKRKAPLSRADNGARQRA